MKRMRGYIRVVTNFGGRAVFHFKNEAEYEKWLVECMDLVEIPPSFF